MTDGRFAAREPTVVQNFGVESKQGVALDKEELTDKMDINLMFIGPCIFLIVE